MPIGIEYHVTVRGAVIKNLTCEHCSCDYSYVMRRSFVGMALGYLFFDNRNAKRSAEETAVSGLEDSLRKGFDPVPCPECGWYQKAMVRALRQRWLLVTSFYALVLAAVIVAPGLFMAYERPYWERDAAINRVMAYALAVVVAALVVDAWIWLRDFNARHDLRSEKRSARPVKGMRGHVHPDAPSLAGDLKPADPRR